MLNTTDSSELAKAEPYIQITAMVREQVQPTAGKLIGEIWNKMGPVLKGDAIHLPDNDPVLFSPRLAKRIPGVEMPLREIGFRDFTRLFDVSTSDQAMCLLRRSIERMGGYYTAMHLHTRAPDAGIEEAGHTQQSLRGLGLNNSIGNGFSSGAADVIGPLHNMILDVCDRHGPDAITTKVQTRICERHFEFALLQAMFSIECLAGLDAVLRQPAVPSTLAFLRQWSELRHEPGRPDECFMLDAPYGRKYFQTKYVSEPEFKSDIGTPIVDYRPDHFSAAERQRISSTSLRLGCPSLGLVHREFTAAMCRAYFTIVFPKVKHEYSN